MANPDGDLVWCSWKPLTGHRCVQPKDEPWEELPRHWTCPDCGQLHHRASPSGGPHRDVDDQGRCAAYRAELLG